VAEDIQYETPYCDWETRGYWEGAGRCELVLQRCTDCGVVQHRPRAVCAACLGDTIEHFVASGRGTVHTFTITHQNGVPGFARAVPYVFAYVDLEEGPRLLTNVVGCPPEDVTIGMPVQVDFVKTEDGLGVPRFVPR
jgi:hypothetical protein